MASLGFFIERLRAEDGLGAHTASTLAAVEKQIRQALADEDTDAWARFIGRPLDHDGIWRLGGWLELAAVEMSAKQKEQLLEALCIEAGKAGVEITRKQLRTFGVRQLDVVCQALGGHSYSVVAEGSLQAPTASLTLLQQPT